MIPSLTGCHFLRHRKENDYDRTDNKDHYKATEDFARKLIDHAKPQTHADAIRAMSDEELEAFLIDVDLDKEGSPFITEWGKWLKQPAEVYL